MLSHHGDETTGILSYMELTDLPFIPRRMYYISKVPKGEIRGKHGHYKDEQVLYCLQGKIKVKLINGQNTTIKVLQPGESVFLDRMVWSEQEYMTGEDIMLVLCSRAFDKNDYFYEKGKVKK